MSLAPPASSPFVRSARGEALALAAVFFLALTPFISHLTHTTSSERFYRDAAIFMRDSGDWLTPLDEDGSVRLRKPILVYWIVASSHAVLGVTPLASRLPFALAGSAVVCLAYLLALQLGGRRDTARLAALILLANPLLYVSSFRSIPDIILCLGITISGYGFLRLLTEVKPGAAAPWAAYLGAAAAVQSKGMLALLFIAYAWSFAWACRRSGTSVRRLAHAPAIGVALALMASWFAAMWLRHGGLVFDEFLDDQAARKVEMEFAILYEKFPRFLSMFAILFLPWSVIAAWGLVRDRRAMAPAHGSMRLAMVFTLGWCLVLALLFSLGKRVTPRYLLPAFPLVAICLADWIRRMDARAAASFARAFLLALLVLMGLAGGAFAMMRGLLVSIPAAFGVVALWAAAVGGLWFIGSVRGRPFEALALGMLLSFPLALLSFKPLILPDAGVNIARVLREEGLLTHPAIVMAGPKDLASEVRVHAGGLAKLRRISSGDKPLAPPGSATVMIGPAGLMAEEAFDGFRLVAAPGEVRWSKVKKGDVLRAIRGGDVESVLDPWRQNYIVAIPQGVAGGD